MTQWNQLEMEKRLIRYVELLTLAGGPPEDGKQLMEAPIEQSSFEQNGPHPSGFRVAGLLSSSDAVTSFEPSDSMQALIVHTGRWCFTFGLDVEQSTEAGPGDVVSVSPNAFASATKLDDGPGSMWRVSTDNDSDHPVAEFTEHLMKDCFIDTSNGSYELRYLGVAQASLVEPVVRVFSTVGIRVESPQYATSAGVHEAKLTPDPVMRTNPSFEVRQLSISSSAYIPMHTSQDPQVVLVQEGMLEVTWDGGVLFLGPGDNLAIPTGLTRAFRNTASVLCVFFVVTKSNACPMDFDYKEPATD